MRVEGGAEQRRRTPWKGGAVGHHQASRETGRRARRGPSRRGRWRPGSSVLVEQEKRPSQWRRWEEASWRAASRAGRIREEVGKEANWAEGESRAREERRRVERAESAERRRLCDPVHSATWAIRCHCLTVMEDMGWRQRPREVRKRPRLRDQGREEGSSRGQLRRPEQQETLAIY